MMHRQFKEEQLPNRPNEPPLGRLDFQIRYKDEKWVTRISSGKKREYTAPASFDQIKKINRLIVDDIGHSTFGLDFAISDQSAKRIRRLAQHGKELFDALIADESKPEFLQLVIDGPIRRVGEADLERSFLLTYEQACRIWWQFIYFKPIPESEDQPIDLTGFLGTRALFVADCLVSDIGNGSCIADLPPSLSKPATKAETPIVRHVWDNNLLSENLEADVLWHDGLSTIRRIELSPPLDPDPSHYIPMRDRLAEFVTASSDALHFDCHGLPEHEITPWTIDIGVLRDFTAKNADMLAWNFQSIHLAIGVLNVCYSGRGQLGEKSDSLAESFIAQGMSAVIAPMAKAPLLVLMEASRTLYDELLKGASLLAAFSAAQMKLLAEGNPAGLALVLHLDDGASADDFGLTFEPDRTA